MNYQPINDKKFRTLRGGKYSAVHWWLRNHYGAANRCDLNGCISETGTYDWAKLDGYEYVHDINSFMMMCHKCHVEYDQSNNRGREQAIKRHNTTTNEKHCRNGHERTEQNTTRKKLKYVTAMFCLECKRQGYHKNKWKRGIKDAKPKIIKELK